MKNELVAIPVFQNRISPLLDEARRFVIFEIADGAICQKIVINLDLATCAMRISRLKELGVITLVSGAVSGDVSDIIIEKGFRHYPWNSGDVNEIMELYLRKRLRPCRASVSQCRKGKNRKRCCSPLLTDSEDNTDNEERKL